MVPNKCLIYKRYTVGWPVPGEHLTLEDRPFDPEAPPPPNGFTVKNHYLSFEPYQRGQMRLATDQVDYSIPWTEDQPALLSTLATVLKSNNEAFKPGDLINATTWAGEYAVVPAEMAALAYPYPPPPPGVNISQPTLIGALGMAGMTAYISFNEYVKEPRAGKTFLVSAASGGVGQIVGQLAKMHGMKVIGSTGSQEKVDFVVKELGFDGAWNYKEEKTADALKRLAPEGIDVYYDNVGGEQLETTLLHMNHFGQIVVSGMISIYNDLEGQRYGVQTLMEFVFRRLTMTGFIFTDEKHRKYLDTFAKDMVTWLAEGKIKTKEHVLVGMESAPEALIKVWKGEKFGKMVLKVD